MGVRVHTRTPMWLSMNNVFQKQIVWVLFTVLFMVPQNTALGLEILAPDTQVSTELPRIHVVGRTTCPEVVIELNGEIVGTTTVRDSLFHFLVHLPYGLNEITVKNPAALLGQDTDLGKNDWGTPSVTLDVMCGPRIPSKYQKVFTRYVFHGRDDHELCLDCHDGNENSGVGQDADWCLACHPVIKERFVSHSTNDMQVCTNCHRIEADLKAGEMTGFSEMNPCFLCHKDKIGEFAQDFIHGPVAGGTCTVCHNPHGSVFDKNLRTPVPVLCLYCHTDVEGSTSPVQHAPFKDGQCVRCHDPHATGNRWVLVSASSELCFECHDRSTEMAKHKHPFGVKPNLKMATSLPLTENGKLECLTCHFAHGSQAPNLLKSKGANLCLGCHPEHE